MRTVALTSKELYWMRSLCTQALGRAPAGHGPTHPAITKVLSKLARAKRHRRKPRQQIERVFRDYQEV